MKKMIYLSSFLFFFPIAIWISACNNEKEETPKAENDVDAARNFIRSTMDGDYRTARTFLVPDSQNLAELEVYERYYNEKMKPEEKQSYKTASINVHEIKKLNDSTTIIFYSNSFFKKDTHQLKSVRIHDQWLVDFKYYFQPAKDSLP